MIVSSIFCGTKIIWFRASRLLSGGSMVRSGSRRMGFFVSLGMYYFYMLYSKSLDRFYPGHTSDLKERLRRHITNHKGYTGKAKDWQVVYNEQYTS